MKLLIIGSMLLGLAAAAVNEFAQATGERTTVQLFNKHCSSCHGKDGRAKTLKSRLRYHARNLTDASWQNSVSDERIFNSIFNGKGKMPAFGKKLEQAQVEALVSHVRAFRR